MERTNAMHVKLPEKMDLITIDTSWTKQILTIPNAFGNLKEIKDEKLQEVLEKVKNDITAVGGKMLNMIESPILGEKGKNKEYLALILTVG